MIPSELFTKLFKKEHEIRKSEKNILVTALRTFNYHYEASEINFFKAESSSKKEAKNEINKAVKEWFAKHNMQDISIFPDGMLKDIKMQVDFLILGFNKYGIKEQRAIIIEIEDPLHFACNVKGHLLGEYIMRKKIMEGLKFELQLFKLLNDVEETKEKILKFLDHKYLEWKKATI